MVFFSPVSQSNYAQILDSAQPFSEVSENKKIQLFGQATAEKKRPLSLRILSPGGVFDQLTRKLHGDFDLNFSKHDNLFCGNRIELIFDSGETLGLSLSIKREMSPIARTRALLSGFKFPDSKPGKNVFSKNNR